MFKNHKGQSTLEYFIMAAGVIAVLVVFLKPDGVIRGRVDEVMTDSLDFMEAMVEDVESEVDPGDPPSSDIRRPK